MAPGAVTPRTERGSRVGSDTTDSGISADAMTDGQLVVGISRRRPEALREAYERCAAPVFAGAARLVGNRRAEDVVQDVFLQLWNHPERFDASRGSLRTYLTVVGQSRAIDIFRADGARRDREARVQTRPPEQLGLEAELWTRYVGAQVRSAMGALPEGERRAIEVAYFHGRSYRQAAAVLGVPEGTVKSRIRSGLGRLRSLLVHVVEADVEPWDLVGEQPAAACVRDHQ